MYTAMAGRQKNRRSTSWWPIINTTILHRNDTMKQKQKKRKLADGKTRQRATRGIGYEIN